MGKTTSHCQSQQDRDRSDNYYCSVNPKRPTTPMATFFRTIHLARKI
jgi:hypothetical protein